MSIDDRTSAHPSRIRPLVLFGLVLAAALIRLIPHPPNFTPIGAMALFGGAYFASRAYSVAVPLAAMLISDCVLAVTHGWALGWMTLVIYACIGASVWFGARIGGRARVSSVASNSFLSALLFFIVVNFAVWAGGTLYPMTAEGLMSCYIAAIPFFGNTLAGYAVYGLVLFGGFELLQRRFEALAPVVPATARA